MTDLEHKEIRGITGKIIAWLAGCTIAICSTCIWGAVHVESTMILHSYRLDKIEARQDKQDLKIDHLLTNNFKK